MTTEAAHLDDVLCIVVHHRSPATLFATIDSIAAAGVPRGQIVVVDNGGDAQSVAKVQARDSHALQTANRGYAAAANEGVRFAEANGLLRPFVLIATHESTPAADAVIHLRDAMEVDPMIAAAGPTLWDGADDRRVWSRGGYLTRGLALPRHHLRIDSAPNGPVDREWLDGAFTMYRGDQLRTHGFDESYFLYFEETDLHMRLRRAGHRVVWVPDANASQTTGGTPARLLGRNLFLFQSRFYSVGQARAAVVFEAGRAVARFALRRRGRWNSAYELLAGWLDGERLRRGRPTRRPYPSEGGVS